MALASPELAEAGAGLAPARATLSEAPAFRLAILGGTLAAGLLSLLLWQRSRPR